MDWPTIYRPFLHPRNRVIILAGFFIALYSWSTFTWTGLVTVDRYYRQAESRFVGSLFGEVQPFDDTQDLSRLEWSIDEPVKIMVQYPDNHRVGLTEDGVQVVDARNTQMERLNVLSELAGTSGLSQIKRVQTITQKPLNGTYRFDITAHESGLYRFNLVISDRQNLYTQRLYNSIPLKAGQVISYEMRYHKDAISRTQIKQLTTQERVIPFL